MKRLGVALLLALSSAGSLSACSASESCVSWREYRSPADQRSDASLVVLVDQIKRQGTKSAYGADANVYDVRVSKAEKGAVPPGRTLRIVSTPSTCQGSAYPQGDPLAAAPPLRLYLSEVDGRTQTLTPTAGVEASLPQ